MNLKGKKLFRIKDGKLIAGVAGGIAQYLELDVNVVRIFLVLINILTSGSLSAVYGIAWILLPVKQ